MTVAGQITDEQAEALLRRLRDECTDWNGDPLPEDGPTRTYVSVAEGRAAMSLLTELQHRREAEAGTPEGWKLIPRRPTEDMMQAGNYQSSHDSTSADVYSAWVDMWDAAPSPDEYENPIKLERKAAASPSSPASGVRVKALEWVQSSFGGQAWRAHSILGLYRVAMGSTAGWAFEGYDGTEVSQRADDIDAAKSAAQADYEGRILSALGEHP